MMHRLEQLSRSLSYSNVIATLALFVALGGTAFALSRDSVSSREIKDNSVKSKDIRDADVRGKDIRNGTLTAADFRRGHLPVRAYGEVTITDDLYTLVEGNSKNVVSVEQGGGGNPAACVELDDSIDASTAIAIATPNARRGDGGTYDFDSIVSVGRPFGYCGGQVSNGIEFLTQDADAIGGVSKRAFFFIVI